MTALITTASGRMDSNMVSALKSIMARLSTKDTISRASQCSSSIPRLSGMKCSRVAAVRKMAWHWTRSRHSWISEAPSADSLEEYRFGFSESKNAKQTLYVPCFLCTCLCSSFSICRCINIFCIIFKIGR